MDYLPRSCGNLNFCFPTQTAQPSELRSQRSGQIFLSSISLKANGQENSNFNNFFLEGHQNPCAFLNLRHLYQNGMCNLLINLGERNTCTCHKFFIFMYAVGMRKHGKRSEINLTRSLLICNHFSVVLGKWFCKLGFVFWLETQKRNRSLQNHFSPT